MQGPYHLASQRREWQQESGGRLPMKREQSLHRATLTQAHPFDYRLRVRHALAPLETSVVRPNQAFVHRSPTGCTPAKPTHYRSSQARTKGLPRQIVNKNLHITILGGLLFLRIRGRRAYLLHNYRDGCSRVRQRCLFRTDIRNGLAQWATEDGWMTIQERIRQSCPEVLVNWPRLKSQLSRAIARWTGCEPPASRPRARTTYDPSEPEIHSYLAQWEVDRQRLRNAGLWEKMCYRDQLRQRRCPAPEGARALAESLHHCGKYQAAIELWAQLPRKSFSRYFNSAAAYLQMKQLPAGTDQLLRGLNRNHHVAETLRQGALDWDYWRRYAQLWDRSTGQMMLHLMRDAAVRSRLWRLRESRCRARKWRGTWWFGMVLGRLRPRIEQWGLGELHLSAGWQLLPPPRPPARRANLPVKAVNA